MTDDQYEDFGYYRNPICAVPYPQTIYHPFSTNVVYDLRSKSTLLEFIISKQTNETIFFTQLEEPHCYMFVKSTINNNIDSSESPITLQFNGCFPLFLFFPMFIIYCIDVMLFLLWKQLEKCINWYLESTINRK